MVAALQIPYPPGMELVTVRATIPVLGGPSSARYRVISERKFGYTGTDRIFNDVSPWKQTSGGVLNIVLPFSDAPGLIGDFGQPLDAPVGYKILVQPTQSAPIETKAWQYLLRADGAVRNLIDLSDLGSWQHAPIYAIPNPDPTTPGDDDDLLLVEKSPGVWGFADQEVV